MQYQDTTEDAAEQLSHDAREVSANREAMHEEDQKDQEKESEMDQEDGDYIYSSPPSSSQESRPIESDAKFSVEESEADGDGDSYDSYDIDEDLRQYSRENSVFRRSVTPRVRRAESTVKMFDVDDNDSDSKDSNTEDECDPYEPASSSPTTRVVYQLPHEYYIPYPKVLSPRERHAESNAEDSDVNVDDSDS